MTRAASAEARAEPDEQPGHGHDGERTQRPVKRGALPELEAERGAADQAGEKYDAPYFVGCRRDKETTEHTGDAGDLAAQHGGEQSGEADEDAADDRVKERVLVHPPVASWKAESLKSGILPGSTGCQPVGRGSFPRRSCERRLRSPTG